jgi:hypothetical protein
MERVCFLLFWLTVLIIPTQQLFAVVPEKGIPDDFNLFEENGKVGLKDKEGHVLIPATYDAIGWSNGKLSIVDKVVGYQSDGLWGVIHTSNKVVTPPEFLELRPGEGAFLVAKKISDLSRRPSFGVISTSGKTVIPFLYDGLHLSNMRAIVMSKTGMKFHFGLVDLSNRILIPIEHQSIYSLGSLRYAVESFENKTAIFSDDGTQVTGFVIDSISAYRKNYAIVYQNGRQGLIDRNGAVIVDAVYGEIKLDEGGSVSARGVDTWTFLDGDNHPIGQQQATGIIPLSAETYAVTAGNRTRLTNNIFEPLSSESFSFIGPFENGLASYKKGGRVGIVDAAGKIILQANYRQVVVGENRFLACLDTPYKNSWVLLDASGNALTEKHYERIEAYNGKYFPVRSRGFWGAIDFNGREIVACVHDSLVQQADNHIVVKFRNDYGIINIAENWIVTPQANPLRILNENTYFEYAGKTTFLKSFSGNIIYFSDNTLEFSGDHIRETLPSGAYWIIDMNGIIIDRSNQPDGAEHIFPESEGLRAILKDGKYGFIDDQGRLRIANRYEAVRPFGGDMAAVRIMGKWGFIDKSETLVVQPIYDTVEDYRNGMAIVTKDGQSGLIDERGKVVLPIRYDRIRLNDQKRWAIQQGGLHGLASASGTVIIQPKYDSITDTGNGFVIVRRNDKSGLLTLHGVSTVPMIYDELFFDAYHGHYIALKKSPWKQVASVQRVEAGP